MSQLRLQWLPMIMHSVEIQNKILMQILLNLLFDQTLIIIGCMPKEIYIPSSSRMITSMLPEISDPLPNLAILGSLIEARTLNDSSGSTKPSMITVILTHFMSPTTLSNGNSTDVEMGM